MIITVYIESLVSWTFFRIVKLHMDPHMLYLMSGDSGMFCRRPLPTYIAKFKTSRLATIILKLEVEHLVVLVKV